MNEICVNIKLVPNLVNFAFADEAEMVAWITSRLSGSRSGVEVVVKVSDVPTAIVNMEGGLILEIKASSSMRVVVLDADTDGADEEGLHSVDGAEVYVTNHGDIEVDEAYVESIVIQTGDNRPDAAGDRAEQRKPRKLKR